VAIREDLLRRLQASVDDLPPREQKVLRMRYGLEPSADTALGGVGAKHEVTRARLLQFEAEALRRLRGSALPLRRRGQLL